VAVGQAEIDQAHAAVVQHQRIARMNIAMQHASRMDRGICFQQMAGKFEQAGRLGAGEQRMAGAGDVPPVLPLDGEVGTLPDRRLSRECPAQARSLRARYLDRDQTSVRSLGAVNLAVLEHLHLVDHDEAADLVARRKAGLDGISCNGVRANQQSVIDQTLQRRERLDQRFLWIATVEL
jgi:hypothetical protein